MPGGGFHARRGVLHGVPQCSEIHGVLVAVPTVDGENTGISQRGEIGADPIGGVSHSCWYPSVVSCTAAPVELSVTVRESPAVASTV